MFRNTACLALILGSVNFIQVTGQESTSQETATSEPTGSPSSTDSSPVSTDSTPTQPPSPITGDTCYQFTWLGAVDKRIINNTKTCDDVETAIKPCHAPLVWTNGQYGANHPNITQLENQCREPFTTKSP